MEFTDLVLAGLVSDLPPPSADLAPADAIAYQISGSDDLTALERYTADLPVIAGVSFDPDDQYAREHEATILVEAADAAATDAVEVTYDTETADTELLDSLAASSVDVIVAYRNYSDTPDVSTLLSIVERAREHGDLVYLETMANSPDDSLTMLAAIHEAAGYGVPVGGACMGPLGRHTRVVAPLYGSRLAYAPFDSESDATAPGQYSLRELAALMQEAERPSQPTSLHEKLQKLSE